MEETVDYNNLEFHEKLGEGGGGTVSRVTFKKPFKGYTEAAAKSVWDLREEEVEIMRKLHHPHIVEWLAFYKNGPLNLILLEYGGYGSLHDYLSDNTKPLPEILMRKWLKESALAIKYLHELNVLHRDIKPHNCILFNDNILKLCDFGLARAIEQSQTTSTAEKGTYYYMAPEIFMGNKEGRAVYSKPADIYSYGMLTLEITKRKPPWEQVQYPTVMFKVTSGVRPTIPRACPQDISDMIQRCWNDNPQKRPTIQDIVDDTQNIYGTWMLDNQFANIDPTSTRMHKLHQGCEIAIHANGDVAIFDCTDVQGHVYDNTGVYKFSLGEATPGRHISHFDFQGIAAAPGPNGNYYVACGSSSANVKIYNTTGELQGQLKVEMDTLDGSAYEFSRGVMFLAGMTFDHNSNLLIGVSIVSNSSNAHFISKHEPSGKRIASIPTEHRAQWLTVTPHESVVYTYPWGPKKAVMIDQTGKELRILPPPTWVKKWRPTGICCSSDTIFVANDESSAPKEYGVYCYSFAGEYMGCATQDVVNPTGLALTDNGNKLLVALYEGRNPEQRSHMHGVKVFRRNHSQSE